MDPLVLGGVYDFSSNGAHEKGGGGFSWTHWKQSFYFLRDMKKVYLEYLHVGHLRALVYAYICFEHKNCFFLLQLDCE